ncbi:biotin--acetyl-CoA-carboxylase ligase [Methanomicrobiaceae archaeon CYW5]|uniref:biotin--[acetyl-CoA-carboxylase] ligase n=1 Tax=Methanovulcanius yangii TaxID=1789227 RepID=UPI0029CA8ECC|nr:biotin--[acetyl-CoA-carboxylase] ligase [Methanovulcanius yangii]MBT8507815.1 biotin--acetyl-CoA-carboxylase ligase [Methanovulcanius yangii]
MIEAAFRVLKVLEESDTPISGEEISKQLDISRSAVWKHVQELRSYGYEIASSRAEGYDLIASPDRLLPYEIEKHLKTWHIGRYFDYHDSVPSTIGVAKELCRNKNPSELHGMVVIAEEQSGGVGRLGRAWYSPRGGIWTTIILRPAIPVDHVFMVTMAASIAVARTIRKFCGAGALIKWPNDIYIGNEKIAGVLQEISAEAETVNYCLLSIGIDANISEEQLPSGVKTPITTLFRACGAPVDRARFLAQLLREFETRYREIESGEYHTIAREWKSLSLTLDKRVKITTPRKSFEGEAIDIDEYGALIVRKDNGKVERVFSGDCTPA